jgi:hypothetical protein
VAALQDEDTSERARMKAPILIVGAHRSGTTVVTQTLSALGLFTGHPSRCDHNAEPFFFLRWHENYLRESGAAWHQPQALLDHLASEGGHRHCRDFLRRAINGRWGCSQSMLRRYAGRAGALSMLRGGNWGWKDPRTTLFAPVWLEIFPGAKVLHVLRHPLNAARSLQARQKALVNPDAMTDAPQLENLQAALQLVGVYVERGMALQNLGDRYCQVHYEDLQNEPHAKLQELAEFCELPKTRDFQARLQNAAAPIEREGHAWHQEYSQAERDLLWSKYPAELRFDYF